MNKEPSDPQDPAPTPSFWPDTWWKLMELRIGVIPVPVVIVIVAIIVYFLRHGKSPAEAGKLPTEISIENMSRELSPSGDMGNAHPI